MEIVLAKKSFKNCNDKGDDTSLTTEDQCKDFKLTFTKKIIKICCKMVRMRKKTLNV